MGSSFLTPQIYGGSLTETELRNAVVTATTEERSDPFEAKITVREDLMGSSLFRRWTQLLSDAFPKSKLVQFPISNPEEFYHGKYSVRFASIGISSFDPITHWQFMWSVLSPASQAISKPALDKLVRSHGPEEIRTNARALETLMISEGLYMPMVFSPSLNFVSNDFEGDPKLEDEWGLQAWTYRWRGKE